MHFKDDLDDAASIPFNRAKRRRIAKENHVPFSMANARMMKRPPLYLGINRFKRAMPVRNNKLVREYKENAYRSLEELQKRRAGELAGK